MGETIVALCASTMPKTGMNEPSVSFCHSRYFSGQPNHQKGRGEHAFANDEYAYRYFASGPIISVRKESGPNLRGGDGLQSRVSVAEARMKDTVADMMPSRYISKQSHSSYAPYVGYGRMIKKNSDVFLLLELLNEG